jgi:hypothetical protein
MGVFSGRGLSIRGRGANNTCGRPELDRALSAPCSTTAAQARETRRSWKFHASADDLVVEESPWVALAARIIASAAQIE